MALTAARLNQSRVVLQHIVETTGLSAAGAKPLRLEENDVWLLPSVGVVRIARPGRERAAAREVAVARWLADQGFPAVRPLSLEQPVHAGGRAATFWEVLPPHRPDTAGELAPLLRDLHRLPVPDIELGTLDPFFRIAERLEATQLPTPAERAFLHDRLDKLRADWRRLPEGLPRSVIHGDAWGGNCAITADGPVLLDFEWTCIGPPEWDLTYTAAAQDTFGSVIEATYRRFVTAYGHDVRSWEGYSTLRAIRELQLVSFALQIAEQDPAARTEARHRIDCVRGRGGARPWGWTAVG
ncbi:phosphotransferase enzyme family protein [Streptomyces sp. NPDC001502]|uniref:phosphotransferase enzyme family protein n=1 Tax=Streptomyces sp. NPDC001502 TaxID=3364578 RepID=UPI0036767793